MSTSWIRGSSVISALAMAAVVATAAAGTPTAGADPQRAQCLWPGIAAVVGDFIPLAGDFDGNGQDEVFWYGPGSAPDSMWRQRAPGFCWKTVPVNVSGTYLPLVGDFGGDGYDDIMWIGPGNDPDRLWLGQADGASSHAFVMTTMPSIDVSAAARPFVGDFDVDGASDVFLYDPGVSTHEVRYSNALPESVPVRANQPIWRSIDVTVHGTYQPIVGEFHTGGGQRLIFWDKAGGTAGDRHWSGNLAPDTGFTPHNMDMLVAGDYQPLVGDYDRDHDDDIFWYEAGPAPDALWWVYPREYGWSWWYLPEPSDPDVDGVYRPIVGDFEGDGRDGIWWYAPGGTNRDPYWRIVPDHLD